MNIFLKTCPKNFDNELFQMINLINFFLGKNTLKYTLYVIVLKIIFKLGIDQLYWNEIVHWPCI